MSRMNAALKELKSVLLIVLGIFSAGMGLKGFLLSSRFIDGGVTGISMLLANVTRAPLAVWIVVINLPFIAIGYRRLGRKFALKSAAAISGLAICLATVHFPDVTPDRLLTAVFGGFFIGAGIGLAMRGGAVLDGTEIAALLVSRESPVLRVGDVILILNVFVFGAAAFLLGIESALYSILTYVAASRTVDFLVYGIEQHMAVIIVSRESESTRAALIEGLQRAVTVYEGRRGRSGTPQEILCCVVTRLEIAGVKNVAKQFDPDAFIMTQPLADVDGGMVKRHALHAAP
jgi:uncharacterized membrane-anchored protein YitT (DUF2179 family)